MHEDIPGVEIIPGLVGYYFSKIKSKLSMSKII